MLSVPDFSGQGIPVDAKAMQPAADLPPPFQQLSLLRGHGFTADELRTMSHADVAREYVQAVREGAQTPGGAQPEAHRRAAQAEGDRAVQAAQDAAHIRAMQKAADQAVQAAKDAARRKRAIAVNRG
jgi:phage-related tail fiber protein